jgi:hypothetical protein
MASLGWEGSKGLTFETIKSKDSCERRSKYFISF